jgi:mRNA-degrading endonuclease toxin of MazEF toxin-antitoxin module
MKRGDVVVADFPFQDLPGSKIRPAVVIQNDADNRSLANTISRLALRRPPGQPTDDAGPCARP